MKIKIQTHDLLLKIMKISLFQLFLAIVCMSMAYARESHAQELLNRKISIQAENRTVKRILGELGKEANVRFIYSVESINANRVSNLTAQNQALGEILESFLKPMKINFRVSGDRIILSQQISPSANMQDETENINEVQAITITGQVTESGTGNAIPGVSIVLKGTQRGTNTGVNGEFKISVPDGNAVLVFNFVGYKSQEILIGNRTQLNVALEPDNRILSEVVVVGYGTQKRANVTGAIGSIKTSDINNVTTGNSSSLIQGKVAGVRVESGGGAPGGEVSVIIRGTGTLGNDQPLYVVDGNITSSMSFLNPNDIESIEVLKDASAAAIYGNRAANGVVIITTKQGAAGVTKINFSTKIGIQSPVKMLKYLNARQYADYRNQANDNDNQPRALANDKEFNPAIDTDWQSLSLNSAPIRDYSLSISGGGEHAKFFLSGQFYDQTGIVVDSYFNRYNFRANSSFTKGNLKLSESFSASRSVNNPNSYFGRERGEIPTIPVYNSKNNGGFAGVDPVYNGVARGINWYGLAKLNDNLYTTDEILGSLSAEYEIIPNLKYKLNLGLDYSIYHAYNYTPSFFFSRSQEAFNDIARLEEGFTRSLSTLVENTLSYSKSFGKHNVDLLAGYTDQVAEARNIGVIAADFPTNDLRVIDASNVKVNSTGGLQRNVLQSMLGRINYNFAGKYLLSATIRRDGSSRFAKENRFGTFPSVSAGWRVSEEAFFPKSGLVSDLKVRGSYGKLGSQNIGNYVTTSSLNIFTDYYFGGVVLPGTALTNFANPNVVWETTNTSDFGADLQLLNGKIAITMDYFNKRSEGILTDLPIPRYGGVGGSIVKNAATIENKGFEFSGTYNHKALDKNGLNYSITANFSTIKNNVLSLGDGVNPISGGAFTQEGLLATRTEAGHPLGSFYGFIVDGLYQNQDEIAKDGRTGNATLGDFKYRDLNGDHKIDNNDRTYLGSPIPDFEYGTIFNASYKNFDFSMFWQGVQGNKIWNSSKYTKLLDYGNNHLTDQLRAWTPTNTNTDIPRNTILDPANNKRSSSFYVEDGSYLRLKSIQLGYTLPASFTQKIKIDRARIYVSSQNLLTFTSYTGYSPEVGRNGGNTQARGLFGAGVDVEAYPQAKSFFLGIDISF